MYVNERTKNKNRQILRNRGIISISFLVLHSITVNTIAISIAIIKTVKPISKDQKNFTVAGIEKNKIIVVMSADLLKCFPDFLVNFFKTRYSIPKTRNGHNTRISKITDKFAINLLHHFLASPVIMNNKLIT